MYPLHAHPLQIIADFDSSHLKASVVKWRLTPTKEYPYALGITEGREQCEG
jgi:hypothetical protein